MDTSLQSAFVNSQPKNPRFNDCMQALTNNIAHYCFLQYAPLIKSKTYSTSLLQFTTIGNFDIIPTDFKKTPLFYYVRVASSAKKKK